MRHSFARLASGALAALAALALGAPAGATTPSFCDFSAASTLQVAGNASAANGILTLTTNNVDQTGAAWFATPIPIAAGTSLHTYFRFRVGPDGFAGGGDGIAFALQSSGPGAIGSGDGSLGYGGITPSFGVTFTIGQAFSSAQVALYANGDTSNAIASAAPSVAIDSDKIVYVWIDFDGASKMASVSMAGSATRPATPLFTGAADLTKLGAQAYAGFTAATDLIVCSEQDILEWELSTAGSPCCTSAPGGACSGATPVCGASGVCEASSTTTSSSSSSGTGGSGSGTGGEGSGTGGKGTSSSSASSGTGGSGTGGSGTTAVSSAASSTSSGGGAGGARPTGPTAEGAIVEGGGCSCRASSPNVSAAALVLGALAVASAAVRRRRA